MSGEARAGVELSAAVALEPEAYARAGKPGVVGRHGNQQSEAAAIRSRRLNDRSAVLALFVTWVAVEIAWVMVLCAGLISLWRVIF